MKEFVFDHLDLYLYFLMHYKMLARMYEIDFLKNMDLVREIQTHKVFVMLYYLFMHYMLLSKIQIKKKIKNQLFIYQIIK